MQSGGGRSGSDEFEIGEGGDGVAGAWTESLVIVAEPGSGRETVEPCYEMWGDPCVWTVIPVTATVHGHCLPCGPDSATQN